jgi:hypothetical protein
METSAKLLKNPILIIEFSLIRQADKIYIYLSHDLCKFILIPSLSSNVPHIMLHHSYNLHNI